MRIVLNLNVRDSEVLSAFLVRAVDPSNPAITHGSQLSELQEINKRIENGLNKVKIREAFAEQGIINPSLKDVKIALSALEGSK